MEARDRGWALGLFGLAVMAWIAVAAVLLTQDPMTGPGVRYLAAGLIGLAAGLTTAPLFWLVAFARHRRISYRGDWSRAIRRGAWVAGLIAIVVLLRLEQLFQLPIALFIGALVVVAEASLSSRG